ncbi:MAG: hypothetical protein JOZ16_03080 [Methylobacteriaceae bacterium]|nr:hypothetical protein [Methylobacteriaceae bacterium]
MNFEAEELGVTALVTGNQLKAARALAAVEQLDLAELSKVSIGTLRDMEAQEGEPIGGTAQNVRAVQKALEGRGIEFLNDGAPGVRLKKKRGIK